MNPALEISRKRFEIIAYKPQHFNEVIAIFDLLCPQYFHEMEKKDLELYLNEEREYYWLILDEAQIIGTGGINTFPEQNLAKISWDLIHPDHQQKGVGKQLLEHRLAFIQKELGVKNIRVRTSQLAYKFYEKAGFTVTEYAKDYWAPGFDLYDMQYIST